MQKVTYKIVPDPAKNSIGYSKNYRIFTTGEPVRKAVRLTRPNGYKEELDLGNALEPNITRKLRYSTDRANWSLWYTFTPSNLTELELLEFEESDIFFEVKYEYDDGTYDQLAESLKIEWIKIGVETTQSEGQDYSPPVQCSEEKCPMITAEKDALFKPYDAGTAVGIAHELSLQTNKIFGHEVVYFKTEPDRDGGDFIFKEWTLFKTTNRRCIKVVVPENKFPDNKPTFSEFGVDFEIPFEVHIDNVYFQQMFGRNAQPRKKDYLYFPLLNRMYEIQGSYLYRGFMMEPMYWKIQLTKFHPNIDMFMKPEDRQFLDNLIMSSDQLFGNEAASQALDALDKQQFTTISDRFDETRRALHPELKNKIQDITFNYSKLIEYYYDMSPVKPTQTVYTLSSLGRTTDQILTSTSPKELWGYEDSDLFAAWLANSLETGDYNFKIGETSKPRIKTNGPKDSYSALGKYVVIEGYKTLGFKTAERVDILEDSGTVSFMQSDNAIVYKKIASTSETPNMTYCSLVNFIKGTQVVTLFRGYDDTQQKGLIISGSIVDSASPTLTIYVQINSTTYTFAVGTIEYGKWYALIVPVSAQYGQLEVNVYSFSQDPANVKNFNGIEPVLNTGTQNIGKFDFETTANFAICGANYWLANVRLFNTMIQTEDHEFVISQLFVRDESTLAIIDNCRPRLNAPFIAINR